MTIHFLGKTERVVDLAENVRFVLHPPILSTERVRVSPIRSY